MFTALTSGQLWRRNLAVVSQRVQEASARGVQPEVLELLADESWRGVVGAEFRKPYMAKLEQFLHQEWSSHKVFPPQNLIFRSELWIWECSSAQNKLPNQGHVVEGWG